MTKQPNRCDLVDITKQIFGFSQPIILTSILTEYLNLTLYFNIAKIECLFHKIINDIIFLIYDFIEFYVTIFISKTCVLFLILWFLK